MPKKDWEEITKKIGLENLIKFKNSTSIFFPDTFLKNSFNQNSNDFSAKDLKKLNPAKWIPLYKKSDITNFLLENKLMPIRSGKGSFFFYKGDIFFDLSKLNFKSKQISTISKKTPIPLTLNVPFHKNENAFLNKAVALGIINNFLECNEYLCYGQSGKITISEDINFYTSKQNRKINKGFQFEIDLVLESTDEIVIFEAKNPTKEHTKIFSLLQLYYPLIYIDKITNSKKKIRTIFFDILKKDNKESYRLVEIKFKDKNFDNVFNTNPTVYTN